MSLVHTKLLLEFGDARMLVDMDHLNAGYLGIVLPVFRREIVEA